MYIHLSFLGVKPADRRERSGYLFPEFERLVNSGELEGPLPKLEVAGSIPVSRSITISADSVTHQLFAAVTDSGSPPSWLAASLRAGHVSCSSCDECRARILL